MFTKGSENFPHKTRARRADRSGSGWAGKQNGDLLTLAESRFDVLVTVDTHLRHQQNLEGRRIAIVILEYSSNRLEHLRQYFPACALALEKIQPGEIVHLTETP